MKKYNSFLSYFRGGVSVWLATLVALSTCCLNYWVLKKEINWNLVISISWLTFFVYRLNEGISTSLTFQKQVGVREKISIFRMQMLNWVPWAIPGLIGMIYNLSWEAMIWILAGAIVALSYSYPIVLSEWRKIPGLKGVFLSLTWTLITGVMWVGEENIPFEFWVERSIYFWINGQIFDWRDRANDQHRGVKTLPILTGTFWFAFILVSALVIWLLLLGNFQNPWSWLYAGLVAIPVFIKVPLKYFHGIDFSMAIRCLFP